MVIQQWLSAQLLRARSARIRNFELALDINGTDGDAVVAIALGQSRLRRTKGAELTTSRKQNDTFYR